MHGVAKLRIGTCTQMRDNHSNDNYESTEVQILGVIRIQL